MAQKKNLKMITPRTMLIAGVCVLFLLAVVVLYQGMYGQLVAIPAQETSWEPFRIMELALNASSEPVVPSTRTMTVRKDTVGSFYLAFKNTIDKPVCVAANMRCIKSAQELDDINGCGELAHGTILTITDEFDETSFEQKYSGGLLRLSPQLSFEKKTLLMHVSYLNTVKPETLITNTTLYWQEIPAEKYTGIESPLDVCNDIARDAFDMQGEIRPGWNKIGSAQTMIIAFPEEEDE